MDKSANGRVTLRGHLDDVFLEGEWNLGGVLEIVLERGFQLIQRDRHIYTHTHTYIHKPTQTHANLIKSKSIEDKAIIKEITVTQFFGHHSVTHVVGDKLLAQEHTQRTGDESWLWRHELIELPLFFTGI